jgi:hypothetical protein
MAEVDPGFRRESEEGDLLNHLVGSEHYHVPDRNCVRSSFVSIDLGGHIAVCPPTPSPL